MRGRERAVLTPSSARRCVGPKHALLTKPSVAPARDHETAAVLEVLNAVSGECQIPHGRQVLSILILRMSFRDSSADKAVRSADSMTVCRETKVFRDASHTVDSSSYLTPLTLRLYPGSISGTALPRYELFSRFLS